MVVRIRWTDKKVKNFAESIVAQNRIALVRKCSGAVEERTNVTDVTIELAAGIMLRLLELALDIRLKPVNPVGEIGKVPFRIVFVADDGDKILHFSVRKDLAASGVRVRRRVIRLVIDDKNAHVLGKVGVLGQPVEDVLKVVPLLHRHAPEERGAGS